MGEKHQYAIRMFVNNVDFVPEYVEGDFDIPFIKPEKYDEAAFIPFNEARASQYKRERYGVHFFIHDYQFESLWNRRERFRNMLPEFKAVMTPEYSVYIDWPVMLQMWNHYRKHLIGAWMQSIGCKVYPTITWGNESSYSWCFDGEPFRGTVCVSSVGKYKDKEMRKMFIDGYNRMLEVLEPETIIFHGTIPEECTGNIVPMESFTKRFKEMKKHD